MTEIQTGQINRFKDAVKLEMLCQVRWIVLTSKHGVEAFFASLKEQKIDFRNLRDKKFAVIGAKTEEALELYGFYGDLIPSSFNSTALREALEKRVKPEEGILYGIVSGERNREILQLKERYTVVEACLYENQECQIQEYQKWGPDVEYDAAFFTCASSVNRFLSRLSAEELRAFQTGRTEAVSIGKSTTEALRNFKVFQIRQASSSTYYDMLSEIVPSFRISS